MTTNPYLALVNEDQAAAAPVDAPNEIDDLILNDIAQRKARRAAVLQVAVDTKPDAYALQKRVAGYLGYVQAAVEATPEASMREAHIKKIDEDTAKAPVLAARFVDADFSRLGHDDSGPLSLFETLGNSFKRGLPGLKQTLSGTALRANANMVDQIDKAQALLDSGRKGLTLEQDPHGLEFMTPAQRADYRQRLGASITSNATSIATQQAEKARYPAPAVTGEVMAAKSFGEAFSAFAKSPLQFIASIGPESLVSNAPGLIGAAVAPGGAAVKAAIAGVGSGAVDYGSQVVDGLTRAGVDIRDPAAVQAATRDPIVMKRIASEAIRHAGVVGAVDGLSGGAASRLALPGKTLSKAPVGRELANLAVQTPVQGALGGIGEAGGELAAGQPLDPGSILSEVVGEAFGAPAEVAGIAGGRVSERMAQAREAKAHAAEVEALSKAATESKLRDRDTGAFAAFAKDATEDSEVFISAQTFAQAMKPEDLAKLPPQITEQLPEALASGGDIAIKVGDFAAHLADVPGLVRHLRADPEAMTQAEADSYVPDDDLRAEVERIAPSAPAQMSPQGEALAQARQMVIDQLTAANRFTPEVNARYTDLIGAFLTTTAERAGLDVDAIKALVPRIVSQLGTPRAQTLDQTDGQRGAFDPSTKTIALLEHADLSTFLHESGHFFLDATVDQALRADAPAGIKTDVQTLMSHFGVADAAAWKAMTLEQQREHHEQFARGFETYLMEGKAPTAELAGLFSRFRSWLLAVYRRLAPGNVAPEVRAVMDRMLATDQQIADTQQQRNLEPLFADAAKAGMTPDEFARYQTTGEQATEAAVGELQGRALRDLRMLSNAKRREVSKLTRDAKAKRDAIEAEVTAEIFATPVYAAWRDLTRGHTEDGQPIRLSRADVEASHPDLVDRLPPAAIANSERALPADMVAEAYGLTSGDELVRLLATLDKPAQVIEAETDHRMLQRYGELADQRGIEEAAHAAIANDARARVLTTEANALARAVGSKPLLTRAAKEFAAASVAQRKVRDLRPHQFEAAESRAGREAAQAFKKGDVATAAAAKRTQLLQHVLGRTTRAAVVEVEKAVDYLTQVDRSTTLPPEYRDQIDQLLERVDLRKAESLKAIDRRKSLAAWVASQEELGFSPVIDEALLNEAARQSYKEMTVEALRGLVDTVKSIEHLGRLKDKLLTARDERAFSAVVSTVADGILSHGGAVRPIELEGEKGFKFWLQGALASTRKLGSLGYRFDGGKDNGPVFDALIRPMNEAGTAEAVAIEKATLDLTKLLAPIQKLKGGATGAKVFIPEIGASLSRGGRLSVALNWGNDGNRQRLTDGQHWSAAQVQAIVSTLSPVELQFVNEVHAYVDSFWPEIKAQQLRVSGVAAEKVEATPWTATASDGTTVQMTGGYYPAKYDTARSAKAESHDAAQAAKDMLQGAYTRSQTRRGHTKARSEEVKDRPLRLDLGVLVQHVNEVVHNLSWQEWLIDANRLMGAKAIDAAIRSHYGPAVVRTIKDDLAGIAVGDTVAADGIEKGMLWLRSNMTRATLGASFTTALMQPMGLSNSVARIGAAPVLRGLAHWAGDAARFESSMTWVAEKSDFMRLRSKQLNREISEISGRINGKSKTAQVIDASLMFLTTKAQQLVDIPTWIGAYEKAQAAGSDEATSVALADEAVLSSQGGGQTKDLAQVQRNHKFLTSFFSYFSTTANLIAVKTATTDFRSPKAVAGWTADMALLAVIPALGPAVLKSLLQGGGGDDGEGWARFLAKQQAGYLLSMLPLVRELSGAVTGFGYSGPPVARVVTDVTKLAQQVQQGEVDEPAVAALARFFGDVTGAPMTQIMRSYKGWKAWEAGEAPASSVLMGPPQRPD